MFLTEVGPHGCNCCALFGAARNGARKVRTKRVLGFWLFSVGRRALSLILESENSDDVAVKEEEDDTAKEEEQDE